MDIDKVILENQNQSYAVLSELTGKSEGCIEYRLKKLGIKKLHPRSAKLTQFVKENPDMPVKKIVEIMGAKKASVIRALRRIGVECYQVPKKEYELFKVKKGVITDVNNICPGTGIPYTN